MIYASEGYGYSQPLHCQSTILISGIVSDIAITCHLHGLHLIGSLRKAGANVFSNLLSPALPTYLASS